MPTCIKSILDLTFFRRKYLHKYLYKYLETCRRILDGPFQNLPLLCKMLLLGIFN